MKYLLFLPIIFLMFCRLEEEPTSVVESPKVITSEPLEELWKQLRAQGLYTKSYKEFQSQYGTREGLEYIRKKLVSTGRSNARTVEELLSASAGFTQRAIEEAQKSQTTEDALQRLKLPIKELDLENNGRDSN